MTSADFRLAIRFEHKTDEFTVDRLIAPVSRRSGPRQF